MATTCAEGVPDCLAAASDICATYNGDFAVLEGSRWLLTLSLMAMAAMAFYVGANDVANAFGTSVGSRAISMKWALIIGGVANWAGSITLGYGVSDTVQNGVADVSDPECWACGYCDSQMSVYAVGMLASLISATIFIAVATVMGMPVSTTHAIVGAVMGMTIFQVSGSCLDWNFESGLSGIIASWGISPIMSGVIGIIIYAITSATIMKTEHAARNAVTLLPILYAVCAFALLLMILLKSPYTLSWNKGYMVLTSFGVGLVTLVLSRFLFVPFIRRHMPSATGDELAVGLRRKVKGMQSEPEEEGGAYNGKQIDHVDSFDQLEGDCAYINTPSEQGEYRGSVDEIEQSGYSQTSSMSSDLDAQFLEEYNKLTSDEKDAMFVFRYLLIMVATLNSYAHGANDTANATGPMGAIYSAYQQGLTVCDSDSETEEWIMAVAGGCICLGVIVHGIPVMRTIGSRISVIDMHRAFAMEMASTLTVVIATLLTVPVSALVSAFLVIVFRAAIVSQP
jgi:sodium-dependent phosphate transporter